MTRNANWTPITVRNFVGKAISIEVDVETKVSRLKDLLNHTTLRLVSGIRPRLAFDGHELRDHRHLSYYEVTKSSVLHILPPSKDPKVRLCCHSLNGIFSIDVDPGITVSQLMKEISIEEKIPVHSIDFATAGRSSDERETVIISDPEPLPHDTVLRDMPLTKCLFYVRGPPAPAPPPASFFVTVELYDQARKLLVETKLHYSLSQFRKAVKKQHNVSITRDILILVGKELLGEDLPIWDLGFVPGCTIHAVPFISFNVELADIKTFDTLVLHPLTPLSKIRRHLRRQQRSGNSAASPIVLHRYGFTLDGRGCLKEWRTLWDLNVVSGSTIYLRPRTISITLQVDDEPLDRAVQMDVEGSDTIEDIKERWELISEKDPLPRKAKIYYRDKLLHNHATVKQEGFVGGEVLRCVSCPWVRRSSTAPH